MFKPYLKRSFLLILLFLTGGFFLFNTDVFGREIAAPAKPVKIRNSTFYVELAKTKTEQERGLMFKQSMDQNKGMLFVFEVTGIHLFWMKDTYIPLDMIWISEDKRIVYIKSEAQPHDKSIIDPKAPAKYVLEINGGLAKKYGFQPGDKVLLPEKL